MNQNKIVLYQTPDGGASLEVRLENETVWLSQKQIAELFGTKRLAITKHLGNIFSSKELDENSVSSILEHTASDSKVYQTKFYNLDVIISVGYQVNYSCRFRYLFTTPLSPIHNLVVTYSQHHRDLFTTAS